MPKMTFDEAIRVEHELYDLAVGRYLDKTDWDVSEWLSDEEYKKYNKAMKIIQS